MFTLLMLLATLELPWILLRNYVDKFKPLCSMKSIYCGLVTRIIEHDSIRDPQDS